MLPAASDLVTFDSLSEAVIASDEAGRVIYANAPAEALLGWPRGTLLGEPLTALMPERMRSQHAAGFAQYMSTREPRIIGRPVRVPAVRKDGSELDIELTLSALRGLSGADIVLATLRDRTSVVELEHQGELLALLEVLLVSAPVALGFVDRNLRFVRVNERLAQINGKPVHEHLGRTLAEIHPNLAATLVPIYQRVLDTGEASMNRELAGLTGSHDGSPRWYRASHYPVRFGGAIVGVGALVEDITEQKQAAAQLASLVQRERAARAQAEAEKARLHAFFMQAPAAIAILRGPEHVYELSNQANNLGLAKDPTGEKLGDAFPELAAQGFAQLLDVVYNTGQRFESKEVAMHIPLPSGGTREQFVNGVYQAWRGAEGNIEGVLVFGFDVTEQVRARQRAEHAEAQSRDAVRMRDEFISVAGHELRTPLAAALLQVQNLRRQAEKSLPLDLRTIERLSKVSNHIERLGSLVAELLDVSRIAEGRLSLRPEQTDLAHLAAEVLERFEETAARARCALALHAPEPVLGSWDRARLDQVITNLLGNGIKYGAGRPVKIEVLASGARAVIRVHDQGIGVQLDAQARVFERFERAVSERHYGGLGLGLWICREIVHAHEGTINLTSEPGTGTTVEVDLPCEPMLETARAT